MFADPFTAIDYPLSGWLWKDYIAVPENPAAGVAMLRADIRTQRKLGYGQPIFIVDNIALLGTAFTVVTNGLIRCLFLRD